MIGEGAEAPAVDLPAYADGERTRIDLGEYLGEEIVVLAFYPADFNPGCTLQDADIGDLDLFTMQKDVSVFCVSPDSTFSHEAFADRYGLHVPLLSDVDSEAAERYGVGMEDRGERLCKRAVFVIDHRGEVQYAWATSDLEERPDVDPVKAAVGDVGGDDTALERYRVGHERYAEGRDAFERAMAAYEDREWLDAQTDFETAEAAFGDAADHLDTAVRFAESAPFEAVADRSEEKADTLRHAAKWLAESADAFASGRGGSGQSYRDDAQAPLDAATDLPEPPDPDRVSLEDGAAVLDDDVVVDPAGDADGESLGIADADLDAAAAARNDDETDEARDTAVDGDLELDEAVTDDADEAGDQTSESDIEGDAVQGDLELDADAVAAAEREGDRYPTDEESDGAKRGAASGTGSDAGPADRQTQSSDRADGAGAAGGAEATGPAPSERGGPAGAGAGDGPGKRPGDGRSDGAAAADGEDGNADEAVELDLTDPSDVEDDDEDDDGPDWNIPGR